MRMRSVNRNSEISSLADLQDTCAYYRSLHLCCFGISVSALTLLRILRLRLPFVNAQKERLPYDWKDNTSTGMMLVLRNSVGLSFTSVWWTLTISHIFQRQDWRQHLVYVWICMQPNWCWRQHCHWLWHGWHVVTCMSLLGMIRVAPVIGKCVYPRSMVSSNNNASRDNAGFLDRRMDVCLP